MLTYAGAFKAVVNTETKEIVGATIFSAGAQEIINNILTVAMDNKIHLHLRASKSSLTRLWLKTSMIYLLSNVKLMGLYNPQELLISTSFY